MQTLQEYILKRHPTILPFFVQLDTAVKIIASKLRKAGLEGNLGLTGTHNIYGEPVQKLDDFCNTLIIEKLAASGQIHTVLSEELDVPREVDSQGVYVCTIDPIDGSSNIDVGVNIGTIFSIYDVSKGILQKGSQQICAGYVLYGFTTLIVFTFGDEVHGFTLDEEVDSFFLTHPRICIPQRGSIFSINYAYYHDYRVHTQKYLENLLMDRNHTLRYIGTTVADVHRTLLKGGVFLYPATQKTPQGKLRLIYEVNPMSFIVKAAGGQASCNGTCPLDILPQKHDETVPVALGSRQNVQLYIEKYHTIVVEQ